MFPPPEGLALTPPDDRAGAEPAPPPDIPPDIRTLPPPPLVGRLTPANDDVRGMLVELRIWAERTPWLPPPAPAPGVEPRGVM